MERQRSVEEPHCPALPLPPKILPLAERYPFCVVWTPIPLLSWIFPFIGHVGICDSVGRIHDFQGPYSIGVDDMLFGSPAKYWDISKMCVPIFCRHMNETRQTPEVVEACRREVAEYDAAVERVTKHFQATQVYNLFTNNCHSYVACVLQDHQHSTRGSWNMLRVVWGLTIHGHYVSVGQFFKTYLPFFLWVTILFCVVVFCLIQ